MYTKRDDDDDGGGRANNKELWLSAELKNKRIFFFTIPRRPVGVFIFEVRNYRAHKTTRKYIAASVRLTPPTMPDARTPFFFSLLRHKRSPL